MKSPRGFAWFPLLAAIAIVFGISGGAYWYEHQKSQDDQSQTTDPTTDCAAQGLPPDCNTDAKTNPYPKQSSPGATNQVQASALLLPQACTEDDYAIISVEEVIRSDDKTIIAYYDGNGGMCVYNVKTGVEKTYIPGSAGEMTISRDGTKVYYFKFLSEGQAINGMTSEEKKAAELGWHEIDIASADDLFLGDSMPPAEKLAKPE